MLRDLLKVEIKLRRTLVFVDFSESRRKQEIKIRLRYSRIRVDLCNSFQESNQRMQATVVCLTLQV